MASRTIVEYFPDDSGHSCGYCGKEDTSISNGMWAHAMTVQDYQDLIDRGWRRSGKYCYKPVMNKTCCPQYTIKCKALDFKMSRSQKKTIKRFNRYINTGARVSGRPEDGCCPEPGDDMGAGPPEPAPGQLGVGEQEPACLAGDNIDTTCLLQAQATGQAPTAAAASEPSLTSSSQGSSPGGAVGGSPGRLGSGSQAGGAGTEPTLKEEGKGKGKRKKAPVPGGGPDPNRPLCQKAREKRRERWREKHSNEAGEAPKAKTCKTNNNVKSLEELLNEIVDNPKHKLEVRLVRSSPRSEAFTASFDESYQVYKKYQMAIHGDPPDKPSERQYTNFLVDSPLQPMYHENGLEDGFGSFHQQYLIDGRIVAVGVMDILPSGVSSVYLYYDPDFHFLSLGTYTALQELAFTRRIQKKEPQIKNYYMGFYIHSCPKMRYKGQYEPSFLLCPESYAWVPIEQCRARLDVSKYSRLDNTGAEDTEGNPELGQVLVLFMRQAMPYHIYRAFTQNEQGEGEEEEEQDVQHYARLVGKPCAQRMLLYRAMGPQ